MSNDHAGCIVAATHIIGDKWNPRILYALAKDMTGFCAIQRELGGVNPRTLSARLDVLEEKKIITKTADDSPHKTSYHLTDKGRELLPILQQMAQWSNTYGPTHTK
jgi:DNA-binding HxlR family transcriptional regulator